MVLLLPLGSPGGGSKMTDQVLRTAGFAHVCPWGGGYGRVSAGVAIGDDSKEGLQTRRHHGKRAAPRSC